jgi:hypothetical protein
MPMSTRNSVLLLWLLSLLTTMHPTIITPITLRSTTAGQILTLPPVITLKPIRQSPVPRPVLAIGTLRTAPVVTGTR